MQATSKSGYTTAPANSSAAEPADSSTTSPTASSAAAEVGTLITAPARSFVAAPPISSTAAQDERSTATSTGSFAFDGVEYPRRDYATIDVLADDYGRDVSSQKFHKPRAQNSDDNHRKTTSESKLPSKKRRYSPHVPVLKKQKVVLNRETLDDTECEGTDLLRVLSLTIRALFMETMRPKKLSLSLVVPRLMIYQSTPLGSVLRSLTTRSNHCMKIGTKL
ncbi:hypothetical protein KRP22_003193 [Phytophthora ramorum]|nr:hypothetical protein KRP22_6844 [Phytophthora ramorum]